MRCTDCFENVAYWRLILALSQHRTLSAAADALDLDSAFASRMLQRMEDAAGVSLLERSQKPVRPTEALLALVPAARRIVRARRDADAVIAGLRPDPHPKELTLRVSFPVNCARQVYLNAVFQFQHRHPEVAVEVLADASEGIFTGTTDVAYTGFVMDDPRVYFERLGETFTCLMASPKYLREFGTPEAPSDLANHTVLARNPTNRSFSRLLAKGRETFYLPENTRIHFADANTCRSALLDGHGIAIDLSFGFLAEELASGAVVPVLPGWHRTKWEEAVCCRTSLADNQLVRELMQMIREAHAHAFTDNWRFWYDRFDIDRRTVEELPEK